MMELGVGYDNVETWLGSLARMYWLANGKVNKRWLTHRKLSRCHKRVSISSTNRILAYMQLHERQGNNGNGVQKGKRE